MPACKPFVSPEALASAAASAAADAEAKRRAATVGSPLSAFAALSPGPSPQRASLGALPSARLSGASVAAPASPSTTDDALMGSSPADAGVQAALQQLAGAGFSSQVRPKGRGKSVAVQEAVLQLVGSPVCLHAPAQPHTPAVWPWCAHASRLPALHIAASSRACIVAQPCTLTCPPLGHASSQPCRSSR